MRRIRAPERRDTATIPIFFTARNTCSETKWPPDLSRVFRTYVEKTEVCAAFQIIYKTRRAVTDKGDVAVRVRSASGRSCARVFCPRTGEYRSGEEDFVSVVAGGEIAGISSRRSIAVFSSVSASIRPRHRRFTPPAVEISNVLRFRVKRNLFSSDRLREFVIICSAGVCSAQTAPLDVRSVQFIGVSIVANRMFTHVDRSTARSQTIEIHVTKSPLARRQRTSRTSFCGWIGYV